jgi:hypothetical protein
MSTLQTQREATLAATTELLQLDFRLAQIAEAIPLPADVDEIFEDRLPATPATHLFAVIGAVKVDLGSIAQALLEAAQATEVKLRQEHRQMQRRAS